MRLCFVLVFILGVSQAGCHGARTRTPEKFPTSSAPPKAPTSPTAKTPALDPPKPIDSSPSATEEVPRPLPTRAPEIDPNQPPSEPPRSAAVPGQAPPPASSQEQEGRDYVFLTVKEFQTGLKVLQAQLGGLTEKVTTMMVGNRSPVMRSFFSGPLQSAQVKVEFKNQQTVEFKNVQLQANRPGRGESGDYRLNVLCLDTSCDLIFATVIALENGKIVYNWPLTFKRVEGDVFLPALRRPGLDYGAEEKEGSNESEPPQLRVRDQLMALAQKHNKKILATVREGMTKINAVYSVGFIQGQTAPMKLEFEQTDAITRFSFQMTFAAPRKGFQFQGEFGAEPVTLTAPESGAQLVVTPIEGEKLFLLSGDQIQFKALLPNETRGTFTWMCSIIVANKKTFDDCALLSPAEVLGILALEGKVGGPAVVKEGEIVPSIPANAVYGPASNP